MSSVRFVKITVRPSNNSGVVPPLASRAGSRALSLAESSHYARAHLTRACVRTLHLTSAHPRVPEASRAFRLLDVPNTRARVLDVRAHAREQG